MSDYGESFAYLEEQIRRHEKHRKESGQYVELKKSIHALFVELLRILKNTIIRFASFADGRTMSPSGCAQI